MSIEIAESEWPMVVVTVRGSLTDEQFSSVLTRMDVWLSREQRFALLLDTRGGGGFSPEQRVLVLDYMKRKAELTQRYLIQAMVIDNLAMRTVFYGINLLFPNRFESKVFAEMEDARAWLVSRLHAPPA